MRIGWLVMIYVTLSSIEKNVKKKQYSNNKKFVFCFLTFGLTFPIFKLGPNLD
jgi:hypothetical protein